VSALDTTETTRRPLSGRRVHFGDTLLQVVAGGAALGAAVLLGLIAYKLFQGAHLALSTFGLGFLTHNVWDPVHLHFGAGVFLFGTVVTSIGALIVATPLAIGIALFLSELAPGWIRGPVGALIETLAAIPSIVIGFWGIIVLVPLLNDHVNPALHSALGWIPLFGPPSTSGDSYLAAIVVLTIMITPIIASLSRELFLGVPRELKEAALALGMTRWEMVRGVVLPYTRGGVVAAMILGLGRALGEAIAVSLVLGAGNYLGPNLLQTGDTIGSKIATQFLNAAPPMEPSALYYLGVILLVLSLIVNLAAQLIVRRANLRLRG
jgi:phosphate transport system permease protein